MCELEYIHGKSTLWGGPKLKHIMHSQVTWETISSQLHQPISAGQSGRVCYGLYCLQDFDRWSLLCHCSHLMDYLVCRYEFGPHSYGPSEGCEDLPLPVGMGIKEWHTKLDVVDGLRMHPPPLNLFNSVLLLFCICKPPRVKIYDK